MAFNQNHTCHSTEVMLLHYMELYMDLIEDVCVVSKSHWSGYKTNKITLQGFPEIVGLMAMGREIKEGGEEGTWLWGCGRGVFLRGSKSPGESPVCFPAKPRRSSWTRRRCCYPYRTSSSARRSTGLYRSTQSTGLPDK